jgi:hypothetical protein
VRRAVLTALALSTLAGLPAAAQQGAVTDMGAVRRTTGDPRRDTLLKLTRPITVDFQDKRLEDIVAFIQTSSGAEIEALWVDDQHTDGLDKEKLVSVRVDNATFLQLIEKVLERARSDVGGENSWQMSETGAFQMGPKVRLNQYKRVEIYDINDLLMELPNYTDVPRIDLQQALQSSGGGGGGGGSAQSPFREEGNDRQQQLRERKERADELTQLLQQLVEPDQWVDNGGSGGSMRYYNGTLIVNAPDYMHRGLNGYQYWPSRATTRTMVEGRRYVSLTGDAGLSRVNGFAQQPVSAVVGGQIINSGNRRPATPGGGR